MSQITINGVEKEIPVAPNATLKELVDTLQKQLTTNTSLIESIQVDGVEISGITNSYEETRIRLDDSRVGDVASIVVRTMHPREYVDETVNALIIYAAHLESQCRSVSEQIRAGEAREGLTPLIDGISTFTDAIQTVKTLLRIGHHPQVSLIEADLLSILSDTLEFQQAGQNEYVAEMLSEHLPSNFAEWREVGLPALLRARDG